MSRRLGACIAAGTLVLAVVAGASAVGPAIYQATKSGPGAYIYVGLTKPSSAYVLSVTTEPTHLPINVSWASCVTSVVRGHSPYRRLVRCPTSTAITVLAQLSNTPAGALSLAAVTGSHVSGRISLTVSLP